MNEENLVPANSNKDYKIPANETHLYHLKLVKLQANNTTKQFDDIGTTQSFTVTDYNQMDRSGFFKTYDKVEVLHNPTKKDVTGPADDEASKAEKAKAEAAAKKEQEALVKQQAADKAKQEAADKKSQAQKVKDEQAAAKLKEQQASAGGAGTGAVTDTKKDNPSDLLVKLREEYKQLTGEDAPADLDEKALDDKILEKKGF